MTKMSTNFDFLVNLFKTSEKAFNEYQAEVVEEYISTLPPDRADKMRSFQNALVDDLNECNTIEERNQRMNRLFWEQTHTFTESFDKLNKVLNGPNN